MMKFKLPDRSEAAIDVALREAERKGFRLAIVGRSVAASVFAVSYLLTHHFPTNLYVLIGTVGLIIVGIAALLAVGTRYERPARFLLFAFDAMVITALLAVAPLSSGDVIPQNLVFFTARVQYFFIVIAAAALTLSPLLVIWAGGWATCGLLGATLWIWLGMENPLSFSDLPQAPSRDVFVATVLNPDFLGVGLRLQEALIMAVVTAISALAVHRARKIVGALARANASQRRVERVFGRYVPSPVIRELLEEGHLKPQSRKATLMFVDIEGFTRLAETVAPEKLFALLNELFGEITAIIDQQGGVVISYIGDAVMASFNAPLPVEDHAARAIEAARAILTMVERRKFQGVEFRLKIGIATGNVAAGTVGAGERQSFTLYGDAVNLSQRLERLTKEHATRCLICETTASEANGAQGQLTSLGVVSIRSRTGKLEIFRLA